MKKILIIITMLAIALSGISQTIEQVEKELIKQKVPHHKIVLAQARHETDNFKSKLCRVNHNLFGIKHRGRYAKYSHWRESIKDYKERISSRYNEGDYYRFLANMGYAKDKNYINKLRRYK